MVKSNKVKSIDFSRGVRGMFANRSIIVVGDQDARHKQDVAPRTRKAARRNPPPLVVEIEADLRHAFPNSASVNQALRAFRELTENK